MHFNKFSAYLTLLISNCTIVFYKMIYINIYKHQVLPFQNILNHKKCANNSFVFLFINIRICTFKIDIVDTYAIYVYDVGRTIIVGCSLE